ncbi:DUF2269 family protein [Paenibacillus sp. NPDC056579]|uniref:DUF2269 family protein n=1 Tax=unclassified Paenibacillus TaxID=185978 RepID=UPI001EF75892|nr:DUF2269 family protein [Paenibacillus sp. H1-7]ULL18335.1 DUF2269 family protein [Paenibacillus sp. H1-7]
MAYKLTQPQKQSLVTIHVLAALFWLGGAVVMLMLGLSMLRADNGEQLYYTLDNMNLVDHIMIRYTALVALLTGLALSVWSQWGLFKYYWIVIKLALTVAFIAFGIVYMGDWLSQIFHEADRTRFEALSNPVFLQTSYNLIGGSIANIAALVFMTAISYLKPFGKLRKKKDRASGSLTTR